jgi:hypothetical protein
MNREAKRTRGVRASQRGRIVAGIAIAAGLVSIAGAAGSDTSDKKAIALDAEAILNRWEPVAKAAGAAPHWREQYATQLRQLPDYLVEQIAAVEPMPDNMQASYREFARAFVNAYANLVLNPRASDKGRIKLGSATNDQVFIPIAPCRIVDTRNAGGPIAANTARNFYFYSVSGGYSWSNQGGAAGGALSACPGTVTTGGGGSTLGNIAPSAAMATVTVVNATAAGNWLVWGGAGDPPGITASTLNWSAGQVLANTTVIPAGGRVGSGLGGTVLDFGVKYNGPSGQADVIVDVVGYFVENRATALECIYLTASGAGSILNGNYIIVNTPVCTAGYTKTGTGCYHQSSGVPLTVTSPDFFNRCTWVNNSGATLNAGLYRAQTVCCRVPGQ